MAGAPDTALRLIRIDPILDECIDDYGLVENRNHSPHFDSSLLSEILLFRPYEAHNLVTTRQVSKSMALEIAAVVRKNQML